MAAIRLFPVLPLGWPQAVLAAGLAALCLAAPARAQDPHPLEALLAHMPPAEVSHEVQYIDVAGLRAAGAALLLQRPGPEGEFAALHRGWAWPYGFQMQQLATLLDPEEGMPSRVGFALTDIGQMLGWGDLPDVPVLVRSSAFPAAAGRLAAVLTERGFESREVGGTTVFHRFADDALSLVSRDPADPFGGHLGRAARLAFVADDILAVTPNWPSMDAVLAAEGGDAALDADLAALIDLAVDPDQPGDLLQFWTSDYSIPRTTVAIRELGPTGTPEQIAQWIDRHRAELDVLGLPPYGRLAIIDRQDGADMIGVLAYTFPNPAVAQFALERLDRIVEVAESRRRRQPLGEVLPYPRDGFVYEAGNGRAIAVMAFRFSPTPEDWSEANLFSTPGQPSRRLYDLMITVDVLPLILD